MVDNKLVERIAQLAKLELTQAEADRFAGQLSDIFKHFDELNKIETQGIEPLITPTDIEFFYDEDEVRTPWNSEKALQNAPEAVGNLYKVPPVVEEK